MPSCAFVHAILLKNLKYLVLVEISPRRNANEKRMIALSLLIVEQCKKNPTSLKMLYFIDLYWM
jgi:hypothetical protein